MVEYTSRIDTIFGALADPVRRDILERVYGGELTVGQIAIEYDMSLAAVSKHLKVLFDADLVRKRRDGKYHYVSAYPAGMQAGLDYMLQYEDLKASTRTDIGGGA
jgi:DNA-binding transcriptional ArsR family regulator